MTDNVNHRIEERLAARQSFFSLVETIRHQQVAIREKGRATRRELDNLAMLLDKLDTILDRAAAVMLSKHIIKSSPPSKFNGGDDFPYCAIPPRFDYVQDMDIPPIMDFTFSVLMMRKWQQIKHYATNKSKCYTNCFYFQDQVDAHIKRGWLIDQTEAVKEYLKLYSTCTTNSK